MAKVTSKANGNGQAEQPEEKSSKSFPALPRPRSRTGMGIQETLEYWQEIHKTFPGRVSGYLFRLFPIIIRPQNQHNIALYVEPPQDAEWILQTWGMGTYRFLLKDGDTKAELLICNFKFQESYAQAPPVLDYLELDRGHKDNRSYIDWLRSKGFLKMPGDEPASTSAAEHTAVQSLARIAEKKMEPQESIEGEAATSGFKIMQTATEAAIKTVQAQSDPTATLKLVEALKGKDDNSLPLILKLITDQQAQTTALLTKLFEHNNKPGIDPVILKLISDSQAQVTAVLTKMVESGNKNASGLGIVNDVLGIVERVTEMRAGGRQGKQEWWQAALDNPSVGRTLETIGGAFMNWSQAQLWARRQIQPQPGIEPAPAPAPDGPIPAPPVAVTQPPNEETMNLAALGAFLQPRFPAFMEALDSGISGAEFAQELFETRPSLGGMDLGTHAQIKAIGRDKILSLLGMAPPEVKALLAGKQTMLVQFLDDFLAWVPEKEDVPLPGDYDLTRDPGERR